MGYSIAPSSSYLRIPSETTYRIDIPAVDQTFTLGDLTTPTFNGTLSRATLDLNINMFKDSAGVDNTFMGATYIQLEDTGSTWRDSCQVKAGIISCPANSVIAGNFIINGFVDIKAYIVEETTYSIRWYLANSTGDFLRAYGLQTILNLYFE